MSPNPTARWRTEDLPSGIRITVPVSTRWVAVAFLGAWLVMWAIAEGRVLRDVLDGAFELTAFGWLWLVGWTFGGLSGAASMIWQLTGEHVLEAGPGYLRHRMGIGALCVSKTYDVQKIRNFRATVVDSRASVWLRSDDRFRVGRGVLAFSYGDRACSIRPGLEPSEANNVAAALSRYLPFESQAASSARSGDRGTR